MAWEHYTDWLANDEHSITRLQTKELVAALRERVQAAGLLMSDNPTYERHPFQRLVVPPAEFSNQPRPISWVISNIAGYYLRRASGSDSGGGRLLTSEDIWQLAIARLPSPVRPPSNMLSALEMQSPEPSRIHTRHYWNLCRSAIQVLQWPVFRFNPGGFTRRVGVEGELLSNVYTWEDAFADWLDEPEGPLAGGLEIDAQNYRWWPIRSWSISGTRMRWELNFPEIPYGNGPWEAWTRMVTAPKEEADFVPSTMRVKIGNQQHDMPVTFSPTWDFQRWSLGTGWTVSGPLTIELQILPYPSTARNDYDAWVPEVLNQDERARRATVVDFDLLPPHFQGRHFLATTPQFTHP